MSSPRRATLLAIALGVLVLLTAPTAQAGDPPCPANFTEQDAELTCFCTADDIDSSASVWGTDTYTNDSSICRAAVHVGLLDKDGGTVRVRPADGCKSYKGSTRNGISSDNWGKWGASFYFPDFEGPNCDPAEGQEMYGVTECPSNFSGHVDDGVPLTCVCPPDQASGTVWGTQTYTSDSALCTAAVHAGVIDANGGLVTVTGLHGCTHYQGTSRNGVDSKDYNKWESSFFFPVAGAGECAQK